MREIQAHIHKGQAILDSLINLRLYKLCVSNAEPVYPAGMAAWARRALELLREHNPRRVISADTPKEEGWTQVYEEDDVIGIVLTKSPPLRGWLKMPSIEDIRLCEGTYVMVPQQRVGEDGFIAYQGSWSLLPPERDLRAYMGALQSAIDVTAPRIMADREYRSLVLGVDGLVRCNGTVLPLQRQQLTILRLFLWYPETKVTYDDIREEIYGGRKTTESDYANIRKYMSRLGQLLKRHKAGVVFVPAQSEGWVMRAT